MVKFDTPGRLKLLGLDLGPSEIARRIGPRINGKAPHPGMVSRWLQGDSRPNDAHRPIIHHLWPDIVPADWLTVEERREFAARRRDQDSAPVAKGA